MLEQSTVHSQLFYSDKPICDRAPQVVQLVFRVREHPAQISLGHDDVASPTGSPVIDGLVSTPSSNGGIGIIAMFFVVVVVIVVITTLYSSWEG